MKRNSPIVFALLLLLEAAVRAQVNLADFGFNSTHLPRERPVLVILADFPLKPLNGSDAQWHQLMFDAQGFSGANYEQENSNGRFSIIPARSQPLRLHMITEDRPDVIQAQHPLWGSSQVDAEFLGRVIRKAIDSGFNFAPFDANGDHALDSPSELSIVVVNSLRSDGGAGNRGFIAQQDVVNNVTVTGGAISLDHYPNFDTITHEFGHSFGVPYELYTLRPGGGVINQGMTVMSSSGVGSNRADLVGTTAWDPGSVHFDPWLKMKFGWSEPKNIVHIRSGGRFDIPVASSGSIDGPVILYDPARIHEFFILEYRSASKSAPNYDNAFGRDGPSNNREGLVIWQVTTQDDHSSFPSPWIPADPLLTQNQPGGYSSSILCRCPPDLNVTANAPWISGQTTPPLKWFDGTTTSTRIHILPFAAGASTITVDILAEYDTWVDFSYVGPEDGTFAHPFNTFAEGVSNVGYGGNLWMKPGQKAETISNLAKPMTIRSLGGAATIGQP